MKNNIFSLELDFDKFERFLELFEDAVIISDSDGKILIVNSKVETIFQYSTEELLTLSIEDLIPMQKRERHKQHREKYSAKPINREMGQLDKVVGLRKNGEEFPVRISLNPIQTQKGLLIASEIRDISLDFDVQNRLFETEKYASAILEAVPARILVLDKNGSIEVVNRSWRNFYFKNHQYLPKKLNLGTNFIEFIEDVNNPEYLELENMRKGIQQILSGKKKQSTFEYKILLGEIEKWFLVQISKMNKEHGGVILTFIDITSQKQAQTDLLKSYETTLEGWSRAMDLRDKETEGHTQRVTKMTVEIARKLNIPESEIVHIRRGALLHDMGKLGVPDHILFKPGKLNPEEWKIMKKHPQYAYDMLYPIEYLRSALDIPYSHHEKWDGSGYPQGLKGEEIPLAARIFSVVDVWDALCSDRPYRAGWPKEKVMQYIIDNSGSHFDPKVVDAFIKIIKEIEKGEIDIDIS